MSLFHNTRKKKPVWKILFGSCLALVVLCGAGIWYVVHNLSQASILNTDIVRNTVVKYIGEEHEDLYDLVPVFLGFSEPQTFLVLFLNNTELRPGGGFIGSYATIRVEKGEMHIVSLDGTENLDRNAPLSYRHTPPAPLSTHLGVTNWFFRDSNWSPDFQLAAAQARALYTEEGGASGADIDGVVAVTTDVLEDLLRIVGPVTVHGIEFTADNVIETLEYEVEYAYEDKGIHAYDRKDILEPLFLTILDRMKQDIFSSYQTYLQTFVRLADEKHVMLSHGNPEVQSVIDGHGWGGRVSIPAEGDYLLWVDANLGSLKTDYALERTLHYEIIGKEGNQYRARATMEYRHTGKFDWRTSRYITYARVFAPSGSTFESVDGVLKSGAHIQASQVDVGEELGGAWFGTSFSIEPGQTKTLSFTYLLPASVGEDGLYTLRVQKQLGTDAHTLTLDLDFATLLTTADPPEAKSEWYDGVYRYTTDLLVDREFSVQL